jgi:hypothetical protein
MEFELKAAMKRYRRERSWRRISMKIIASGVLSAPWAFDLGRTDMLICFLSWGVVCIAWELEMRLKTMQLRLAGMVDQLNTLGGKDRDLEDTFILELNNW